MAKISIGTIFVGRENFDTIMTMMYKGKFKNMSHVVDEMITHYVASLSQNTKLVQRIQELNKEIYDLKQTTTNYRSQIVKE